MERHWGGRIKGGEALGRSYEGWGGLGGRIKGGEALGRSAKELRGSGKVC